MVEVLEGFKNVIKVVWKYLKMLTSSVDIYKYIYIYIYIFDNGK